MKVQDIILENGLTRDEAHLIKHSASYNQYFNDMLKYRNTIGYRVILEEVEYNLLKKWLK